MKKSTLIWLAAAISFIVGIWILNIESSGETTLLNVSYDPTREFYQEYNGVFIKHWKEKTGKNIAITQSHGGSGKQARAVIDGLDADVVTLALAYDIDTVAKDTGFIEKEWQSNLPNNSSPYTSTIVFLVRKRNPKGIKDWEDLAKSGVSVITPNPKTSGGARWNYLAAWGYGLKKYQSEEKAREFVKKIYENVPVLDTGARGSTTTFAQRKMGDVLITWENEAHLVLKEFGKDNFEIIAPSLSILAEPPVTVVDKIAKLNKNYEAAEEYVKYLYSEDGQEIAAKHFFRPRNEAVLKKYESNFPKIELFTIDRLFGGWTKAQKTHFEDGGEFDKLYGKK